MEEELIAAAAAVWPRSAGTEAELKRELTRQMLYGGVDIDPKMLSRTDTGDIRLTLARAGLCLNKYVQSHPHLGPKPSVQALLSGDPVFSITTHPVHVNVKYCTLHARRLRALGRKAPAAATAADPGPSAPAAGPGASSGGGYGGGGARGGGSILSAEEVDEFLEACDYAWPRWGGDPVVILKNELARQMLLGGEYLDPQRHCTVTKQSITMNMAQAGISLSKFIKSNPGAADWAAMGPLKLKALLEADRFFKVVIDPMDPSNNIRFRLHLLTLRAAFHRASTPDGDRARPGPGSGSGPGHVPGVAPAAHRDFCPDWPHHNNVALTAVGTCRPPAWRAQLAAGMKHKPCMLRACSRCGFRGHSTRTCTVLRCSRCSRFGHDAAECGAECGRCGLGGATGERPERNEHSERECPFNKCRRCHRVGHYTGECPADEGDEEDKGRRAPAAAAPPPLPPRGAGEGPGGAGGAPVASEAQVASQVEALMDMMFEKMAEVAIELVGDDGVSRLAAVIRAGAFSRMSEAIEAGDGAAVLRIVESGGGGGGGAWPSLAGQAALPAIHRAAASPAAAPGAGPADGPDHSALIALCDAVWPPHAGPHALLKGQLAKLLLAGASDAGGGGAGVHGAFCWMLLNVAGPHLLAFWRDQQQLFEVDPSGRPPFSSIARMLMGDPYLSCRARGASGGELCVVLDMHRLERWGLNAPLPSFVALLQHIDTVWDPQGPDHYPCDPSSAAAHRRQEAAMLLNWLAKLLLAAGNPGASPWCPSGSRRIDRNDAGCSLRAAECASFLCAMWAECPSTCREPFPERWLSAYADSAWELLSGQPLFVTHREPAVRDAVRIGLDVYGLSGCQRPLPGGEADEAAEASGLPPGWNG